MGRKRASPRFGRACRLSTDFGVVARHVSNGTMWFPNSARALAYLRAVRDLYPRAIYLPYRGGCGEAGVNILGNVPLRENAL